MFLKPKSQELKQTLRACVPTLIAAMVFSGGVNLLFLAPSLYMMQVFDRVLSSGSETTLLMLTLIVALALATMALLDEARTRALGRISLRIDRRVADRLYGALVERSAVLKSNMRSQAIRDLDTFRQVIAGPAFHALFDVPWMFLYIGIVFMLHPFMGFVAIAGAVWLVLISIASELSCRNPLKEANEQAVKVYGQTDAQLRNAEVVQAMGMLPSMLRRWVTERNHLLALQVLASDRNSGYQALTKFSRMFFQSLMMAAGAYLVLEREMTGGAMFAATLMMGRALAPVEQLVGAWKMILGAKQSFDRVDNILAVTPPRDVAMQLPTPKGHLEIERLVYVPPGTDSMVLKGISFALQPGESLGIIGPSASGKSTLARLLVGVWLPRSGTVRLDGANVFTWDRGDFGRHVGYMPQDVELFAGTVKDNIARFTDPDPEKVVEAARKAGVHDMILHLKNGYETEIGEGGAVLSGGQRQRIGLARAIYGNPRLLVLDEPNASLDGQGEEDLLKMLLQVKKDGTTVIVIAHRPHILNHMDKMMLLRDGQIELFGPRQEVVARLSQPQQVVRLPTAPTAPAAGAGA